MRPPHKGEPACFVVSLLEPPNPSIPQFRVNVLQEGFPIVKGLTNTRYWYLVVISSDRARRPGGLVAPLEYY